MHWRVTGTDIYFLASVHAADRPLVLDKRIADAVEAAETLAFEADFRQAPEPRERFYPKSKKLSDHIPKDLFADTVRAWSEGGFPEGDLEGLRPWVPMFKLMNWRLAREGFSGTNGIDSRVMERGVVLGKRLMFLEPGPAGLAPWWTAPPVEQAANLARVVRGADEGLAVVRALVDAWASNRPQAVVPHAEKCIRDAPHTYTALLAGRNRVWLPKLLKLIRAQKPAVVTVGAMHMVGPGSLPDLLTRAEFKCEHVQ